MISKDVVILTRAELKELGDAAFQRGVRRGEFEAAGSRTITKDQVEDAARAIYASTCATDPIDAERQPDWGRGGYKTEVLVWEAAALAAAKAFGLTIADE